MNYKQTDRDTFNGIVYTMDYREQDEDEAKLFGCADVVDCYRRADHLFAKYFIVYDHSDIPVVTVMLQRDGHIIFFIKDNVSRPIKLVRVLKRLANKTVGCAGPIITKTAHNYKEALRLNKLIGFKNLQQTNEYGFYYYGDAEYGRW